MTPWTSVRCERGQHLQCPLMAVGPTGSFRCACPCHKPPPGPDRDPTPEARAGGTHGD